MIIWYLDLQLHTQSVSGVVVVVIAWYLDLQLYMQSVTLSTKVVNFKPAHGEVYLVQHYVIKCVGDLRQVGGFLRFPLPI
jgi:hypothetical protein